MYRYYSWQSINFSGIHFHCLEKHDLWKVIQVTLGTLYTKNKDKEKSCLRDLSSVYNLLGWPLSKDYTWKFWSVVTPSLKVWKMFRVVRASRNLKGTHISSHINEWNHPIKNPTNIEGWNIKKYKPSNPQGSQHDRFGFYWYPGVSPPPPLQKVFCSWSLPFLRHALLAWHESAGPIFLWSCCCCCCCCCCL